jgi:hypothetical protein
MKIGHKLTVKSDDAEDEHQRQHQDHDRINLQPGRLIRVKSCAASNVSPSASSPRIHPTRETAQSLHVVIMFFPNSRARCPAATYSTWCCSSHPHQQPACSSAAHWQFSPSDPLLLVDGWRYGDRPAVRASWDVGPRQTRRRWRRGKQGRGKTVECGINC